MIYLICGGRDFLDYQKLSSVLEVRIGSDDVVIHGGARGADKMAGTWAASQGVHTAEVKALWSHSGKAAGPLRNSAMLLLRPDLCIAFPGGAGTRNMVQQCATACVPVLEVPL